MKNLFANPLRRNLGQNLTLAAVLAGFSLNAAAEAVLGTRLSEQLPSLSVDEPVMVVATFKQMTPLSGEQIMAIQGLGINQGVQFKSLPVIGVMATPAQIGQLQSLSGVQSLFLNRDLSYFNAQSRELTGVDKLQSSDFVARNGLSYTGKGVTVMVNDSGIDATLDDLKFGEKVVQNVQAATHAQALQLTGLSGTWIENQHNSDLNVGHGTHCAGTIAGWGSHSNGKHKGAAPDADLIGYGSGLGLSILDALGGYDYALTNLWRFNSPIKVMSNSWGSSGQYEPLGPISTASYLAYRNGILSVFAAGNSGPGEDTHNPYAQIPWGISVGAGTKDGKLADFSSRGKRGETGTFEMPDGQQWQYRNEVSVVAPGVDIISTRAKTNAASNGGANDIGNIETEYLPYYTMISGTSMATPHVAGIVAMMLEANPDLTPLEIKQYLMATATNMPGREAYEVGAGYVNAHAAIAAALGAKAGHEVTVNNSGKSFNAEAVLLAAAQKVDFEVLYSPVGDNQSFSFEVAPGVAWVSAAADTFANTTKLKLTDPDGVEYYGNLSLPVLETGMRVSAPGKPGTWTIAGYGMTSLSGISADPTGLTSGPGLPQYINGQISFLLSGGYQGLSDIDGHPAQTAIEYAISERLMDGLGNDRFYPEHYLRRSQLAQYLVMGAAVRQYRAFMNEPSVNPGDTIVNSLKPYVDAVTATGSALKDRVGQQAPVVLLQDGNFNGNGKVTREQLAYAVVQSLGLQQAAADFNADMTVDYRGETVEVKDSNSIAPAMRGYAQIAVELGLMTVRYDIEQGPYDVSPKIVAYFEPGRAVRRAEYAVTAGQLMDYYYK